VTGNQRVGERAIRRVAGFPEGERFSPERMERSAKRLRDTGAFRSVAMVEAQTLEPGAVMPVTATLVEELPRRFGFGAEIDSSDGLSVSGFWLHRNLFGGAERLRIDVEATGVGADLGSQSEGFDGVSFSFNTTFVRPATPRRGG
jgi:translocation and assembly module TamA